MTQNKETPESEKKVFEKKKIQEPEEINPKEPISMREQLKDLNEKINILTETKEKKIKNKSFKILSKVKRQTKNLKKLTERNKIQVMYLKADGSIVPTIGERKEGMIMIGNKIYNGDGNIIWRWNGNTPTAIISEWDLQPITMDTLVKTTEELKSTIHPQTIMIRAFELIEAGATKKGMSGKALLLLGIVATVVIYIVMNGQG